MEMKRKQPEAGPQPWHSVSIVPKLGACPAAEALRRKRFLSTEAPPLPVPQCTSPKYCKCTYVHHSDRRTTLRRAADRGMPNARVPVDRRDRATGRGRRTDDQGS
jgi:hypothetical protein